jgi:hypothetical protein
MVKRRRTIKRRRKQKGGNVLTFVGKALNYGNLETYPGVTNHSGNHYALNRYPEDLQTGNMKSEGDTFFKGNLMTGGYIYGNNKNYSSMRKSRSKSKRRSSRRKKFRGGVLPLLGDVRTSLQVAQNNVANTQLTLQGKENLVSPLAWKDQYI